MKPGEGIIEPLAQTESELAEVMREATSEPWAVARAYSFHKAGWPACIEECGEGQTPDYVKHDAEGEWHGYVTNWPSDVEGPDTQGPASGHVVCLGHDYDDHGYVSLEDARFIANARTWVPRLLEEAERLRRLVGEQA